MYPIAAPNYMIGERCAEFIRKEWNHEEKIQAIKSEYYDGEYPFARARSDRDLKKFEVSQIELYHI